MNKIDQIRAALADNKKSQVGLLVTGPFGSGKTTGVDALLRRYRRLAADTGWPLVKRYKDNDAINHPMTAELIKGEICNVSDVRLVIVEYTGDLELDPADRRWLHIQMPEDENLLGSI